MIHSILIIGQSNMAGRGYANDVPLDNAGGRIKMLRCGRWQPIFRPVNPDRRTAGVCLAESFASDYALDHPEVEVGIIPCADGGTSLEQWQEGGLLFDNAVLTAKLAMRTSHLVAILWHQGECDCGDDRYPTYFERLAKTMRAMRRELGAEDIPLIVGGLGDFLPNCSIDPALKNYQFVNDSLIRFAKTETRTAFASAEGLGANPDNLHFSAASLIEFGHRYYTAFRAIEDRSRIFDEKSKMDDAIRTNIEQL